MNSTYLFSKTIIVFLFSIICLGNPADCVAEGGKKRPIERRDAQTEKRIEHRDKQTDKRANRHDFHTEKHANRQKTTEQMSAEKAARQKITGGADVAGKRLGSNPFKGKSFEQIDKLLTERGFEKAGTDPASGKGSYLHPESGRKYYLDNGGRYREGTELPHVDVHRMRDGVNLEKEGKRRYPLGDSLMAPQP